MTSQEVASRPTETPASDSPAPVEGGGLRAVSRWERWKFEAVRIVLYTLVRMFSLKGLYLFGRFFGTLEYLINFKRRARYRAQLRQIFPDGVSRLRAGKIIRSYFCRTRCDKLYYLIFDKLPKAKILRRIKFHGRQAVDDGLSQGRGVYVLLSHHGSHHVAGLLMALLGYRSAGIRDRNEGALRVYVQQKYAESFPEFRDVKMLYADSFPRDIYRCFKENRLVGSALDVSRVRGQSLKTCPVQIFGQQREFLTGTLQIALRSRATIVQGFVVSRKNFYYQLVAQPIYTPDDDHPGDDPALVADLMQRYADGIEAHMRQHPDHLSRI